MKTAVIRVDASVEIGTGHVMRCLTLAEDLRSCYDITFITSDYSGHLAEFIQSKGFNVMMLNKSSTKSGKQDELQHSHWLGGSQEVDAKETLRTMKNINRVDLLVVDHYALDYRWETIIKDKVKKIFVIDDLADRKHECDVLLDQNYYLHIENRYNDLVDENCKLLLGPKYALLRNEFIEARKKHSFRGGQVNNTLVFFGGSDPSNETIKVLNAIDLLRRRDINLDVVVGTSNPNIYEIKELVDRIPHANYHYQVSNMAELMLKADLFIGAGGSTTWERCCLGLASVVINIAKNQVAISEAVAATGSIINLGYHNEITEIDIMETFDSLINNPKRVLRMSKSCKKLTDEKGIERVRRALNEVL
ncbi:UDP-2,4-diacetamido-2,4,6-trideoxy-beta-L-altropyranose hydrolase [Bacillus sp. FJAT-45037]|uniref:UDP-2,4-diacetamido-2,4, 6-trideoxy-beta-L-altropyranose hydrolase n=1 Tax=Bacillus sp. FJAT-45037 TaxID=2011007 RepID=UPI000C2346E2|nr:UDP-2,4-diacetamido-2,4,6-trideoxy-beta-L-altropyranose hydrolase [Bacillus sp. FJAT-45037]